MNPSPAAPKNLQSPPSSSNFRVEFFAFPCGHGDTILVHLYDRDWGKWVLVDCYLPRQYGIRAAFFEFLKKKGVNRLDVIVQTHPHVDHFHGMLEVIKHFTSSDERSLGTYFDGGVDARLLNEMNDPTVKNVRLISGSKRDEKEYTQIKDRVADLHEARILKWKTLDAERPGVPLRARNGDVELIPIAPDPDFALLWMKKDARKVIMSPGKKVAANRNRMSIVLVLSVRVKDHYFNLLLGADTDGDNLDRALKVWQDHAQKKAVPARFEVVKVPHHGSKGSLSPTLCALKSQAPDPIAVISAGKGPVLPDRVVIEAFLQSGWRVASTTTRHEAASTATGSEAPFRDRPFQLADRPGRTVSVSPNSAEHLVLVSWSANDIHVSFGPPNAEITTDDLRFYGSAVDS